MGAQRLLDCKLEHHLCIDLDLDFDLQDLDFHLALQNLDNDLGDLDCLEDDLDPCRFSSDDRTRRLPSCRHLHPEALCPWLLIGQGNSRSLLLSSCPTHASLVSRSSTKAVFSHFMVGNTYPYTQTTWVNDIALAFSKGIDGSAAFIFSPPSIAHARLYHSGSL